MANLAVLHWGERTEYSARSPSVLAHYFTLTSIAFDLIESTGRPAGKGRVREYGASAAIHREASGGAAVARAGSPRGQHQQALLLQDVQEGDQDEFHRLPLESSGGEIEDAFAQSQLAN